MNEEMEAHLERARAMRAQHLEQAKADQKKVTVIALVLFALLFAIATFRNLVLSAQEERERDPYGYEYETNTSQ
jgi:hypothetical protein